MDGSGLDDEFIELPGEEIPLEPKSVDTVPNAFSLFSIDDAVIFIADMRRVLKPKGRSLFCVRGAAPDANVRRWRNRLNPT